MNFSSQLDDLIKPFIKPFGNCAKTKLSKESNQILKSIDDGKARDTLHLISALFNEGNVNKTTPETE